MAHRKARHDEWENLLTGVNTLRDARRYSRPVVGLITEQVAEDLYRGSAPGARAVEVPPLVQLGNGFKVQVQTPAEEADEGMRVLPEDSDEGPIRLDALPISEPSDEMIATRKVNSLCDELNVTSTFLEACYWERAYGGCAVLMGLDDGQRDLALPVREETLKGVRYLITLRPRECRPFRWNSNPLSPGYGRPTQYTIQRDSAGGTVGSSSFVVHASRLLIFPGFRASRRHLSENNGWGDSIFVRLASSLRDYEGAFDQLPLLLKTFGESIWGIKGLAAMLASDEADLIKRRVEIADLLRSTSKTLITDVEDELQKTSTPVSGLAEVLDRMSKKWAADVGVPPGLLFGDAPSGLNANGESNLQFFYKEMKAARELRIAPRLKQLVRLLFLSTEGPTMGEEPDAWTIDFGPIYEPTPAEIAELRSKVAVADKAYVDAGVLLPEEVAVSRFGQPGGWNMETVLDSDARDAQQKADEELQKQQLELAKKQASAPAKPIASPAPGSPFK